MKGRIVVFFFFFKYLLKNQSHVFVAKHKKKPQRLRHVTIIGCNYGLREAEKKRASFRLAYLIFVSNGGAERWKG